MITRVICMSIAFLALLTSCTTEELVTPATPTPGQQVTITATLPDSGNDAAKPGTRMGYEENTNATVGGLLTTWTKGDAFNIVPFNNNTYAEGDPQTFTLDAASAGKSEGTFTGTAPDKGNKYRIYHPTSITTIALFDDFSYAEPMQVQTGNDKREHLTAYHAMALSTTDYTTINFSGTGFSQSSCMKFVLTLPDAITPTKITLATADGIECFYNTNTSSDPTASLSMGLSGFGEIAAGTPITAYMMMSCQEVILPETGIIVTVDAEDGSSYTQTILTPKVEGKDVTLKGGKMHTITASRMTKLEPASMTFKVKVTAADNTFSIPFPIYGATPANMTVTWEEGGKAVEIPASTTLTAEDAFNHTYDNADPNGTEYTITITSAQTDGAKQQIPDFNFYSNRKNNSNQKKLISMDTPLLNTGATNFNFCFNECEVLKEIPKELFTNNKKATEFFSCFGKCAALTTIHEALFANNPEATNFGYCFYECKALKEIPEKLFANNKKANNFGDCFSSCAALTTIPAALFANNQEAEKFSYCFYYCKALKEIPEALFANNTKVKDFSYCFNGCEVLTTIPAALFANNPEATNFNYCFYYCAALGKIPAALFTNNREATNFEYCFSYCTSLEEIPQGLFDENTKAEIFSSCFSSCSNLATIPEGLFANNPEATDFRYCFYSCNHAKLNAKIFSMDGNSEGNKRFEGKAMKFDYCFNNTGSSLTDADIVAPQLWKYATGAGTTWTTDGCFAGCKANSSSWDGMDIAKWGTPVSL